MSQPMRGAQLSVELAFELKPKSSGAADGASAESSIGRAGCGIGAPRAYERAVRDAVKHCPHMLCGIHTENGHEGDGRIEKVDLPREQPFPSPDDPTKYDADLAIVLRRNEAIVNRLPEDDGECGHPFS